MAASIAASIAAVTDAILTLNAGSSTLKYALFALDPGGLAGDALLRGQVDALPAERAGEQGSGAHAQALAGVLGGLDARWPSGTRVVAVGHRVVHGGTRFAGACVVGEPEHAALRALEPLAPLHQPHNLAGLEAARLAFPGVPQVAAFDTAFHRGQPPVQQHFALPLRWFDAGVRRYGFHGLSYQSIAEQLQRDEPALLAGRVVVAHLGSGCSMCALRDGRSVASTMGFSALDGLTMATRCGRLDPGVVLHLIAQQGLGPHQVDELLYRQSGLAGLSGTDGDMRRLLAATDAGAALAIEHFVESALRELAGLAAALRGLDVLVFTGGIGEHAAPIRQRIAEGADWLGVKLDPQANGAHVRDIGAAGSRVALRVLRTDEERVIARQTAEQLALAG